MSVWGPGWTSVASSAGGITVVLTRPIGWGNGSHGRKIVARPRSSVKSSVEDAAGGPGRVDVLGGQRGGLKHNLDVFEWHIQVAEAADDLSRDDLLCGVPPVSGVHVHINRLQQANLVVVAKHLHAQVRGPGEVADRQR